MVMNQGLLIKLKRLYSMSPSMIKSIVEDLRFNRHMIMSFHTFLSDEERGNRSMLSLLNKDIRDCRKKYLTTPQEYFLFGFQNNNAEEYRNSFLSDQSRNLVLLDKVGSDLFLNELRNKFNFFKLTEPYFKRGVFLFTHKGCDLAAFCSFCLKYQNLFMKRNSSSKGRGILSKQVEDMEDAKELYYSLEKDGDDWIIEEKIRQVAEMAEWNPSSVNTVRLPSILNEGKFDVLGPFFRTGRNGAIADNAGAGGVFACIDKDTGVLYTDGIDEHGVYYKKHPNSGKDYKGWQVPRWQELLDLAQEIHRTIPRHLYVGWDFALTEKGWVLIEGNWGQFVSQYNDRIGLKHQFFTLLGVKE